MQSPYSDRVDSETWKPGLSDGVKPEMFGMLGSVMKPFEDVTW